MAYASRSLARQARQAYHSPFSIFYNDTIQRGSSRLQLPLPKRDYHTDEQRLMNPSFEEGRFQYVRNVAEAVEKKIDSARKKALTTKTQKSCVKQDVFSKRHKYRGYTEFKRLLDKGAIVEAMTQFKIACNEWKIAKDGSEEKAEFEITPHIIDDIILHLSRISRSPRNGWYNWLQNTSRSSYWSPGSISYKDVNSLHVNYLSYYALLDVYDIGSSLGMMPSTSALSAAILAISDFANERAFSYCVIEVLLRCTGKSFQDAQMIVMTSDVDILDRMDLKGIPLSLICAIVKGYGRLCQSHRGEALLGQWCTSNGASESRSSLSSQAEILKSWATAIDRSSLVKEAPVQMNSAAFAETVEVWTSLVQSRGASSDLAGARYWLQKYRQEGLARCKVLNPKSCHGPHVAYLLACTKIKLNDVENKGVKEELVADSWIAGGLSRFEAVQGVVKTMNEDGTVIPPETIILLLRFYTGYGQLEYAQNMRDILEKKTLDKRLLPRYYIAIFNLHRKQSLQGVFNDELQSQVEAESRPTSKLRKDFLDLLAIPDYWWFSWSSALRKGVLNQALRASLIAKDFPMASRVLRAFKDRHTFIDGNTEIAIMASLEPETLEAIEKRRRRQHHQVILSENLIKMSKEMATEEMPFEQHNFISKPKRPWKEPTLLERLNRLTKSIHDRMLNLLDQERDSVESRVHGMNWINEANEIIRAKENVGRKEKLRILLSPFPHRQETSQRRELESTCTSDEASVPEMSNDMAAMEETQFHIDDHSSTSSSDIDEDYSLSELGDFPISFNVY